MRILTFSTGVVLTLMLSACSLGGHIQRYDFACSQAGGGTAPALQASIPGLLPGYRYVGFLDECTDGGGRALIFESNGASGQETEPTLVSAGCHRVQLPSAEEEVQYECVLQGNAVELTLEDDRIWAVPLPS